MAEIAERLKKLPPYLFEEIDKAKQQAIQQGRPVIDLGVGDPDMPTPGFVVESLREAVKDPSNHKYPFNKGIASLRKEMAVWYKRRFGVELDPEKEILPLLGSKEGIAHIPLAFINPGDEVLVPDPGYPPYASGSMFSGAKVTFMPLVCENNFLPDLEAIAPASAAKCKLMHLNYPNNPTGAVCDKEFYRSVVSFAREHGIVVCSDAAYTEISYDGYVPPSFLEAEGAMEVGVEFHSLSKTFNMTGWRVGMAVGNADIIAALSKVKANVDSGIFTPVQVAAVEALKRSEEIKSSMSGVYQSRRDVLVKGLRSAGWDVPEIKASFYLWIPVLEGFTSVSMAKAMLEQADIIVTPGNGFGPSGEGYIRMALTVGEEKLEQAVDRVKKVFAR